MRNSLISMTALAVSGSVFAGAPAAAQEAEGFQLKIGGFYNALAIVRDTDNPIDPTSSITGGSPKGNIQNYDFNQRGRYRIVGSQTLDNGLELGFHTQYEMQASMANERAYVYASGGFGRVHFGTDRSAMYRLYEWTPTAGWGIDFTGHDEGFPSLNGMGFPTAAPFIANQEMMLTYITPRLSGLQAGVSFAPTADGSSSGEPWDSGSNNRFVTDTSDLFLDYRKVVELGLNYSQSFNGFDVGWSGGFGTGRLAGDVPGINDRRRYVYSTALNVGVGGFDIGASYKFDTHGSTDRLVGNTTGASLFGLNAGLKNEHNINAGITYTTGPWTVGPSFGWRKERAGFEREVMVFDFGARYALAPGADLVGSIQYADYDGGKTGDFVGFGRDNDDFGGDGVAGLFGIQLNF
ncbi:porin [Fodinicurvata halophila]|uniref:Porin n=1 Tax=Fodinicurvata halophila TaxID=1419723 RepID=A0ABV8UMZ0_9PROT